MISPTEAESSGKIDQVDFDLTDYAGAIETIHRWKRQKSHHFVAVVNPFSVILCRRDRQMNRAMAAAGLTLPDGTGIIWAAKLLGYNHSGRVTGPTLMLRLCDWGRGHGYRHFFYGGQSGVAERLARRLSERYPGLTVAGTFSPPFRPLELGETSAVIERINASRPDVLWVGLGAPKQEKWMYRHLGRIDVPVMIGVGAAFDFHSGNIKWAPPYLRRLGLEWAYRLMQEPRRMWKRDVDSLRFMAQVLRQRLRRRFAFPLQGRRTTEGHQNATG